MRNPSRPEKQRRGCRRIELLILLLTVVSLAAAGCASSQEEGKRRIKLARVSRLPEKMAAAPPVVRESYQFALAYPDVLKVMPCYCG